MPRYEKLREELVSHRITLDFDTGARVVGYIESAKPATGPVQLIHMTNVDILDSTGRVLEHFDKYVVVPNVLVGFRMTEGPSPRSQAPNA
jgi:hypothetical protein